MRHHPHVLAGNHFQGCSGGSWLHRDASGCALLPASKRVGCGSMSVGRGSVSVWSMRSCAQWWISLHVRFISSPCDLLPRFPFLPRPFLSPFPARRQEVRASVRGCSTQSRRSSPAPAAPRRSEVREVELAILPHFFVQPGACQAEPPHSPLNPKPKTLSSKPKTLNPKS